MKGKPTFPFKLIIISYSVIWLQWEVKSSYYVETHPLERVGQMKSQKIQKGDLFDSEDEKGVLVKKGGAKKIYYNRSYSEH